MNEIAWFDLEVDPISGRIEDIGCIRSDEAIFHQNSVPNFLAFIRKVHYLCGHNIFRHDLHYLRQHPDGVQPIDTLPLSPLLFPRQAHHHLAKDEKLQSDERNNPVSDAKKARDLLRDEVSAFELLQQDFKSVLYGLLHDQPEFEYFFKFLKYEQPVTRQTLEQQVRQLFGGQICEHVDIGSLIEQPVALAYTLSSIKVNDIPPAWVLRNYPQVQRISFLLRSNPCPQGCPYCKATLDPVAALLRYFGLSAFRTFGNNPLQEMAVRAAIQDKSILVIFPTGGGKSITFQLPALMSGENSKALTVVISPLQSLMKDQVDNLEKKHHITDAVTINGLLSQVERSQAIRRIEAGNASLLFISPESLRSVSIERLLLKREIARFVIDEAHCFSAWGQDFRVDYLHIGDFIKALQKEKGLTSTIPVSCFTATAKQKVIDDIRQYFSSKLDLHLELFRTDTARSNLHYTVKEKHTDDEKYTQLRELIEAKPCPAIIYVSRTKKADQLARQLEEDGFSALAFHGQMDKDQKMANQNAFMEGKVNIMVATSAFGMGVDKADVGMVIHYNISDSLENYVQEAGRAGRNESISADCYILFSEEDLDRHFLLHNQTRISVREINQVWKALKDLTQICSDASCSALEIARKAGWNENIRDIETRIATTIAALEEAKYVRRGQNYPRVYANSIQSRNAQEAIDKINASEAFSGEQKEKAIRIIKRLFSSKSKRLSTDEQAESRVDYLADQLGMSREEVIRIVTILKELKILEDKKDIAVLIKRGESSDQSLPVAKEYMMLEKKLFNLLEEEETNYHLKELNEQLEKEGVPNCSPKKIMTVINFWRIKGWVTRRNHDHSGNHMQMALAVPREELEDKIERRHDLSLFTIYYLFKKAVTIQLPPSPGESIQIDFSVLELKEAAEKEQGLFSRKLSIDDVEDTLFYLSRIDAIRIDGGFMVTYNRLSIDRIEKNNRKQYTTTDYEQLSRHYLHKVQQVHIIGEYARKMTRNSKDALQFAADYFNLDFTQFLKKYFPGPRQEEIRRTLTPEKFKRLFGSLSAQQLKIIEDSDHAVIVVAAGPGSGKTTILVHKLASLLLQEDVKPEQLLMLTFSRSAATAFKKKLLDLIGETAHYVEIKTFHSYCFDLLGRVGNIDESGNAIPDAVEKIRKNEIEKSRITKTVLVIDEAQDIDETQFQLIQALMEQNEDMRVILVGDDDQNIFTFRGADSVFMQHFSQMENAVKYQLTENHRSGSRIVSFANQWVSQIRQRLKTEPGISARQAESSVTITAYNSPHLIVPLTEAMKKAGFSGSTGVLVLKNEEAAHLVAALQHHGIKAQLIQDNKKFNLSNLYELRAFSRLLRPNEKISRIGETEWEHAIRQFSAQFQNSSQRDLVLTIARQFAAIHPDRKYYSDWDTFVRESKLEDFADQGTAGIYVSTIHKAKGLQFDNVWVMLNGGFDPSKDENKRALYVAVTRAKTRLSIHYQGDYLCAFGSEDISHDQDENDYPEPQQLAYHLTHTDVYLDKFIPAQEQIHNLHSGSALQIALPEGLADTTGKVIVTFSKSFAQKLALPLREGYHLSRARVNFILYWVHQETGVEYKIVLPEILLEK